VPATLEMLGEMELERLDQIRPHTIFHRIDDLRVRHDANAES
jgi:hypothetical protein